MVTDEQRHEVAKRLRAMSDEEGKWRTAAMRWLEVQFKPSELADLIEPSERTCQFLDDDIDVGAGWKLPASKCSNCGIKWGYSLSSAWHYCPNCGAKVVE